MYVLTFFIWEENVGQKQQFYFSGRSQTILTRFVLSLTTYPCSDILYGMNVDKKWIFMDHLPTWSCKLSLWTTPYFTSKVWDRLPKKLPMVKKITNILVKLSYFALNVFQLLSFVYWLYILIYMSVYAKLGCIIFNCMTALLTNLSPSQLYKILYLQVCFWHFAFWKKHEENSTSLAKELHLWLFS